MFDTDVPETTFRLLEVHVKVRPVSTFPAASRAVAVKTTVPLTLMLADGGDTDTLATGGGDTVTIAVPDLPSLVAVMVAVPVATAVTSPLVLTRALAESDVAHVTTRPATACPLPSSVDAPNCWVAPMASVTAAGVTDTLATGTGITVSEAWPVRPLAVAMIDTCPAAIAVTTPASLTVAIEEEPVDQVTAPVAIAAPFWSRPAALADVVCPT